MHQLRRCLCSLVFALNLKSYPLHPISLCTDCANACTPSLLHSFWRHYPCILTIHIMSSSATACFIRCSCVCNCVQRRYVHRMNSLSFFTSSSLLLCPGELPASCISCIPGKCGQAGQCTPWHRHPHHCRLLYSQLQSSGKNSS